MAYNSLRVIVFCFLIISLKFKQFQFFYLNTADKLQNFIPPYPGFFKPFAKGTIIVR